MRLDLKDIINAEGRIPFKYSLDLTELDFNGLCPAKEPVQARGEVRNEAGVLTLTAEIRTTLHLICDRCLEEFTREKVIEIENTIANHLESEDDESNIDVLLLEGTELDLDDALITAFIFEMDTKVLCREDCKGLCSGCGANLNREACRCRKEIDPRLAVLAKLLESDK